MNYTAKTYTVQMKKAYAAIFGGKRPPFPNSLGEVSDI
jgi:hypothetical protein